MQILLAQCNPIVGDVKYNASIIKNTIRNYQATHDLIVFPEMMLLGYPPEDLLFRESLPDLIAVYLDEIKEIVTTAHVIVGHPSFSKKGCFNSATIFHNRQIINTYHKQCLPNDSVFDEKRYFIQGDTRCTFSLDNKTFGLIICEDIWHNTPVDQLDQSIDALICINASPFDLNKPERRLKLLEKHSKKGWDCFYLNQVGGQDSLLFDGQSMVVNKHGELKALAPAFEADYLSINYADDITASMAETLSKEALIYKGLCVAIHDYVGKNNIPGVILGLSGGIDSALTLALAVDALGASRVHALLMPTRFTESISIDDAIAEAKSLNVTYDIIDIEPLFKTYLNELNPYFSDAPWDLTEENLQARIRANLLMAFSNKKGLMVLSTSNKSETAVGYSTIYGDMAGGFSPLKDVLKTEVYALSHYRNTLNSVIPERVLTRAPSAELKHGQTDQDSLPDYAVLDAIIHGYLEKNLDKAALIQQGYSAEIIEKVLKLIQRNEYKRRQSAPGPKISPRAFGLDWRMPITSGWKV